MENPCPFCSRYFDSRVQMDDHIKIRHNDSTINMIRVCRLRPQTFRKENIEGSNHTPSLITTIKSTLDYLDVESKLQEVSTTSSRVRLESVHNSTPLRVQSSGLNTESSVKNIRNMSSNEFNYDVGNREKETVSTQEKPENPIETLRELISSIVRQTIADDMISMFPLISSQALKLRLSSSGREKAAKPNVGTNEMTTLSSLVANLVIETKEDRMCQELENSKSSKSVVGCGFELDTNIGPAIGANGGKIGDLDHQLEASNDAISNESFGGNGHLGQWDSSHVDVGMNRDGSSANTMVNKLEHRFFNATNISDRSSENGRAVSEQFEQDQDETGTETKQPKAKARPEAKANDQTGVDIEGRENMRNGSCVNMGSKEARVGDIEPTSQLDGIESSTFDNYDDKSMLSDGDKDVQPSSNLAGLGSEKSLYLVRPNRAKLSPDDGLKKAKSHEAKEDQDYHQECDLVEGLKVDAITGLVSVDNANTTIKAQPSSVILVDENGIVDKQESAAGFIEPAATFASIHPVASNPDFSSNSNSNSNTNSNSNFNSSLSLSFKSKPASSSLRGHEPTLGGPSEGLASDESREAQVEGGRRRSRSMDNEKDDEAWRHDECWQSRSGFKMKIVPVNEGGRDKDYNPFESSTFLAESHGQSIKVHGRQCKSGQHETGSKSPQSKDEQPDNPLVDKQPATDVELLSEFQRMDCDISDVAETTTILPTTESDSSSWIDLEPNPNRSLELELLGVTANNADSTRSDLDKVEQPTVEPVTLSHPRGDQQAPRVTQSCGNPNENLPMSLASCNELPNIDDKRGYSLEVTQFSCDKHNLTRTNSRAADTELSSVTELECSSSWGLNLIAIEEQKFCDAMRSSEEEQVWKRKSEGSTFESDPPSTCEHGTGGGSLSSSGRLRADAATKPELGMELEPGEDLGSGVSSYRRHARDQNNTSDKSCSSKTRNLRPLDGGSTKSGWDSEALQLSAQQSDEQTNPSPPDDELNPIAHEAPKLASRVRSARASDPRTFGQRVDTGVDVDVVIVAAAAAAADRGASNETTKPSDAIATLLIPSICPEKDWTKEAAAAAATTTATTTTASIYPPTTDGMIRTREMMRDERLNDSDNDDKMQHQTIADNQSDLERQQARVNPCGPNEAQSRAERIWADDNGSCSSTTASTFGIEIDETPNLSDEAKVSTTNQPTAARTPNECVGDAVLESASVEVTTPSSAGNSPNFSASDGIKSAAQQVIAPTRVQINGPNQDKRGSNIAVANSKKIKSILKSRTATLICTHEDLNGNEASEVSNLEGQMMTNDTNNQCSSTSSLISRAAALLAPSSNRNVHLAHDRIAISRSSQDDKDGGNKANIRQHNFNDIDVDDRWRQSKRHNTVTFNETDFVHELSPIGSESPN